MSEITSATSTALLVGIHRLEPGVYLRVTKTSRYWLFKYTIHGIRREMGLCAARGQTRGQVRLKETKAKTLLAEGIAPLEAERQAQGGTVPEKHHAALPAEELRRVARVLWETGTTGPLCALFGVLIVGRQAKYGDA